MIRKCSVKEWEDMSGDSVENIRMSGVEVVGVYERSDGEGCSVGCRYVDGRYSVVGLGRDCMCDYRYMFCRVMEN